MNEQKLNCGTCRISTLCLGDNIQDVANTSLEMCFYCGDVYIVYRAAKELGRLPSHLARVRQAVRSNVAAKHASLMYDIVISDNPGINKIARTNALELCQEMRDALQLNCGDCATVCPREGCQMRSLESLEKRLREEFKALGLDE